MGKIYGEKVTINSADVRFYDWSASILLARAFEALQEQARKRSIKINLNIYGAFVRFLASLERTASKMLALQSNGSKLIMKDELEKCFGFIIEVEKLKGIQRRTKPLGQDRYENSAEHSWQISLLALVLSKYADESVNIEKVIKMLLVHDIGEIDADDVFFFDDAGRLDAKEKELAAMERIFGILPDEKAQELFGLWNEFENGTSHEAKFARAIDRVMPVLQNLYNNKQSWTENNVTKEQILTKTAYIGDGSAILWETIAEKIEKAFE